ncbi:MAG: hypothetical protein ACO3MV_02985 [Flavobacteriales bacterium]
MMKPKPFIMEILDKVLGFPKEINGKLPLNHWNETVENSESSLSGWIGKLLHIGALALLLLFIYEIIKGGFSVMNPEFGEVSALTIVGSILSMLIFLYMAFPMSQFIRSAGDRLANSSSGIIEFLFKDCAIELLKVLGYGAALIAFTNSLVGLVSFALDAGVFHYAFMSWGATGAAMIGDFLNSLGDMTPIGGGFVDLKDMVTSVNGNGEEGYYMWEFTNVIASFLNPIFILISLFVSIAIYLFIYEVASRFISWVKSPAIPIKMT